MATDGKDHLSLVICGHVDSGKSTTTGRLLFELGGIPERELEKLKEEAAALGKQSFAFAFYMDRQKEERERGVTISCTTKEFFTDKWHYTIIDAPGRFCFFLCFLFVWFGFLFSPSRLVPPPLCFFFAHTPSKNNPPKKKPTTPKKTTNKQATATSSRT